MASGLEGGRFRDRFRGALGVRLKIGRLRAD